MSLIPVALAAREAQRFARNTVWHLCNDNAKRAAGKRHSELFAAAQQLHADAIGLADRLARMTAAIAEAEAAAMPSRARQFQPEEPT